MTVRTNRAPAVARAVAGMLVVGLAAHPLPGRAAAGGPVGLADYAARLDSARRLADADAAAPSRRNMHAVRSLLGLPVDVQVGGAVVHLAEDPVLLRLAGTSASDFHQASDELAGLEDAARAALANPPVPHDRIASALTPALRGIDTAPGFLDRMRHDVWVIVLSILQRLNGAARRLHLPAYVFFPLALGVVALVVIVIVRRLRYLVPEHRDSSRRAAPAKAVDWDRLADDALARGDFAAALRARYGALLTTLSARGVTPQTPSLTAGECRQAVATGLPAAYPAVIRATFLFEGAFYGRAPVHSADVEAMREAEARVRAG